MKALKCENCGATELKMDDGYYICSYCGSRFIIENGDTASIIKTSHNTNLQNDVERLTGLLEKSAFDPAKAKKYARLILEIDPFNEKAKKYLQGEKR